MSSSYSANQYDSAYKSHKLQNWCVTKQFKERPTAKDGCTNFIADNRGHLLPGKAKRGSAWPDFNGTWDLPVRIPAHHINPTGRSTEGLNRLKSWGLDPQHTGKSWPHRGSKNTDRLQDVGKQTAGNVSALPSSAPGARPTFQNPPITVGETTHSKNQDSRAVVVRSVDLPTEKVADATGKDRPLSQRSATEEMPADHRLGAPSSSRQRCRDIQQDQ